MNTLAGERSVRPRRWLAPLAITALVASTALAQDPPHRILPSLCFTCHMSHPDAGGEIAALEGNASLCMSCHRSGGLAAARPFADLDQAVPGTSGTSHRWDSGPSGHVRPALTNVGGGSVKSSGAFTGRVERAYTLSITTGGDVGSATFSWTDGAGGSGSNLLTGDDVPLDAGLLISFVDGAISPSFVAGDTFVLGVRTDIVWPDDNDGDSTDDESLIATRMSFAGGKAICSACHDQHSQAKQPFDPAAPPYTGSGSGWSGSGVGRHYQRGTNDQAQMCGYCHAPRNVTNAAEGSHPVGVQVPVSIDWTTPTALPLDPASNVRCMSCHSPHFTSSGGANSGLGDGYLLRTGLRELCSQCHALADTGSGSHFSATTGALWPGGQYGSSFPVHTAEKRGMCVNCHWPHGWPDDAAPASDYSRLWVERYDTSDTGSDPADAEDLCYTCHDGSPAQSDIRTDLLKGTNGAEIFHHPVLDSQQSAGRSVECVDCHNPHRATSTDRLAGVTGIDLAGSPVGRGTSNNRAISQEELCFKCHGDTYSSARPRTSNKRLDFSTATTNTSYHPVTQAGRGQSANLTQQLLGGLTTSSTIRCTDCHNSDATGGTSTGKVIDSATLTVGPHGSTNAVILRSGFSLSYTATGWSNGNAALCFRCHDQGRLLAEKRDDSPPSRTNFWNSSRDSLHHYHLTKKSTTASCLSCHFDLHSNRSAGTTQYRFINASGVASAWSTTPPAGVKTHLVNFAPDVQGTGGNPPRWQIDLRNGQRSCWVTCHGATMNPEPYGPTTGDEASHTY